MLQYFAGSKTENTYILILLLPELLFSEILSTAFLVLAGTWTKILNSLFLYVIDLDDKKCSVEQLEYSQNTDKVNV